MLVVEYDSQFSALGQYVPTVREDDYLKMLRFEEGLQPGIQKLHSAVESKDYHEAYRRSIRIESEMAQSGEGPQAKKQKTFAN